MLPGLLCVEFPLQYSPDVPISDRGCPLGAPHLEADAFHVNLSLLLILPCQNTRSSRIPRVWMELRCPLHPHPTVQTCSDTSLLGSNLVWLDKSHDFRAHWAWPSILLPSMLRMMLEQWHSEHSRHHMKADLTPSSEAHACGSEARPLTTTHQLVQATALVESTRRTSERHAKRQTRIPSHLHHYVRSRISPVFVS